MNDQQQTVSITPTPDGPLIVKKLDVLANKNGDVPVKSTMALCRCGQSKNKPFCDGTHKSIGFSSNKDEGRTENKRSNYRGKKITIHDNRGLCAHAGLCTDRLATVFRMKQEPWIDPDAADPADIIAAIEACPSGALSYSVDGVERSGKEEGGRIYISTNGPYVVSGRVELEDTERAEGFCETSFTLCRCGGSKNKPFCDGAHWNNHFVDEEN